MSPNVTVAEAAKILGKSTQFVRVALQKQILPIGVAVQLTPGRWNYHISRHLLNNYIGEITGGKENDTEKNNNN